MHVILHAGEGIVEALFDERDCQMRDINPYPVPAQLLRCVNRGTTTAEGIEDNITLLEANR